MCKAGINAIRTYHLPPEWSLDVAAEWGVAVFVDVPWPRRVCFLDSVESRREARSLVRSATERDRNRPSVLTFSVANEIPASIVRWHGARRTGRFLAELADVAWQADPAGLSTYASYPSTKYLSLAFLDFATFNVYLHDLAVFRLYLFLLQNLAGDKPLVLGELGMGTLRHGDEELARKTGDCRLSRYPPQGGRNGEPGWGAGELQPPIRPEPRFPCNRCLPFRHHRASARRTGGPEPLESGFHRGLGL